MQVALYARVSTIRQAEKRGSAATGRKLSVIATQALK